MKRTILFLCSLMFCTMLGAQTFVSTEPSDKNVVLEEFTGVNCQYCPDGHRIADNLMNDNPGRFFSINIHQGMFADATPDFRTEFGDAIANQGGVSGYPTGIINRHVFAGSSMALDRSQWETRSAQIMAQSSYVNVAARSEIDLVSRELTVNVEMYYTANAPVGSNYLNVALLQNNIVGPQVGKELNPAQIVGNQYNHMHVLRHLLTGQWGDEIITTSEGTLVTKTYTYIIPPNLRDVEYELFDLEVLVFVAESHKEIITGAKSEMQFPEGKPFMKELKEINIPSCDSEALVYATIHNFTNIEINSLQFEYKLNDEAGIKYNRDYKTIAPMEIDTVQLALPVVPGEDYTITVTLTEYNGEAITGGFPFEVTGKKTIAEAMGDKFIFILATDRYASQTSFKIFDSDGNIIEEDKGFSNLLYNGITVREYPFEPSEPGCFKLEVYDKLGNGINSGNGEGYFQLVDMDGNVIFHNDGKFEYQVDYYISVVEGSSIAIDKFEDEINLYPVPARNILYVETNSDIAIEVYNLQGQRLIDTNKKEVNVSRLASGVYLIKMNTNKGIVVKKFIKE